MLGIDFDLKDVFKERFLILKIELLLHFNDIYIYEYIICTYSKDEVQGTIFLHTHI